MRVNPLAMPLTINRWSQSHLYDTCSSLFYALISVFSSFSYSLLLLSSVVVVADLSLCRRLVNRPFVVSSVNYIAGILSENLYMIFITHETLLVFS
jgi:hypothetical protein